MTRALAGVLCVVCACAPRDTQVRHPDGTAAHTIEATLRFYERLGLPRGTWYGVEFMATGSDLPLAVAGRTSEGEQSPLRLTVRIPLARLNASRTHYLRARIVFREATWFTGERHLPAELPPQAEIVMKRVP